MLDCGIWDTPQNKLKIDKPVNTLFTSIFYFDGHRNKGEYMMILGKDNQHRLSWIIPGVIPQIDHRMVHSLGYAIQLANKLELLGAVNIKVNGKLLAEYIQ
jgi:hypothetical protein